jgi:hypothetical protein
MDNLTYDVRIWKTEIYKGAKVTTYKVRWRTGPRRWKQPFRRKAQAASFEAELRSAAGRGEAFDITTGRPVSWARQDNDMNWYDFCVLRGHEMEALSRETARHHRVGTCHGHARNDCCQQGQAGRQGHAGRTAAVGIQFQAARRLPGERRPSFLLGCPATRNRCLPSPTRP